VAVAPKSCGLFAFADFYEGDRGCHAVDRDREQTAAGRPRLTNTLVKEALVGIVCLWTTYCDRGICKCCMHAGTLTLEIGFITLEDAKRIDPQVLDAEIETLHYSDCILERPRKIGPAYNGPAESSSFGSQARHFGIPPAVTQSSIETTLPSRSDDLEVTLSIAHVDQSRWELPLTDGSTVGVPGRALLNPASCEAQVGSMCDLTAG
jgi:hypothetical protein